MLKGKALYKAAREFSEEVVVPALNNDDLTEEEEDTLAHDGALLGLALVIDMAESLNKIATKIG
jgi:hypothetical protein